MCPGDCPCLGGVIGRCTTLGERCPDEYPCVGGVMGGDDVITLLILYTQGQ